MASTKISRKQHRIWALVCIALGLFPLLAAFGVIPTNPDDVHAPMWVVALCGMVFVIGGCMMLVGRRSRLNNLLAGVICLTFAAVGVWVSLFAPPEGFSGGVPLLSEEANIRLARWVFGCGALVCLGMFCFALGQVFQGDA